MSTLSFFLKIETFVYKHLVVLLQGDHTFDFVDDIYSKGQKVIDLVPGLVLIQASFIRMTIRV